MNQKALDELYKTIIEESQDTGDSDTLNDLLNSYAQLLDQQGIEMVLEEDLEKGVESEENLSDLFKDVDDFNKGYRQ